MGDPLFLMLLIGIPVISQIVSTQMRRHFVEFSRDPMPRAGREAAEHLLWQNGNALGEWYMDGTNYIGGGVFSAAAGTWSIAGLSDFNGDGKTDILWSDASGNLAQWQMDGTSYVGGGVFGPKPAGWNLVNTGQLIA